MGVDSEGGTGVVVGPVGFGAGGALVVVLGGSGVVVDVVVVFEVVGGVVEVVVGGSGLDVEVDVVGSAVVVLGLLVVVVLAVVLFVGTVVEIGGTAVVILAGVGSMFVARAPIDTKIRIQIPVIAFIVQFQ